MFMCVKQQHCVVHAALTQAELFLCRAPMLCEQCKRPDNLLLQNKTEKKEEEKYREGEQLLCHCILYIIFRFVFVLYWIRCETGF